MTTPTTRPTPQTRPTDRTRPTQQARPLDRTRPTLRRLGLTLAVAAAIGAQVAGLAHPALAAEKKDTKVTPSAPIVSTDVLKEKKPGDAVPKPIDPPIIPEKKPTLPPIDGPIVPDKKPTLPPLDPDLLKKPDLKAEGLTIQLGAGAGNCDPAQTTIVAEIKNTGEAKANAFAVRLTVDGDDLSDGAKDVDGLAAGASTYVVFDNVALPQGSHSLKMIADANFQTSDPERNNNAKSTSFTCATVAAPAPEIEVASFIVEGKHADDVSDCDPGKNQIYAVVRNNGGAAAGPFAVRMLADGEEPEDGTELVSGLGAGEETVVPFAKVKLKEGPHTLRVIADPDYALGDPNTGNNYKEQTVSCVKE
jgi:hypothetical protein